MINHFVAGMPRSGSTLLCNLLCQNPRFRATGTSPLPNFLSTMIQTWNSSNEAKANYNNQDKLHLLRTLLNNYHIPFDAEVTFDKNRAWPAYIELLEALLQRSPKILVCTRYMPAIVASMEKIWRKELPNTSGITVDMGTLEQRVRFWTDSKGLIGSSYNILTDAVARGHKDKMHAVNYFDLVSYPQDTMRRIHDFLEEPWFDYDVNNIQQVIQERDEFHGVSNGALHTIRPKLEFKTPDFMEVLGQPIVDMLSNSNYQFLS